jgi:predicted histidine transporter YuiF (NhaC family)
VQSCIPDVLYWHLDWNGSFDVDVCTRCTVRGGAYMLNNSVLRLERFRYIYVGSLTKNITSAWTGASNKPLWQQITILVLVVVSTVLLIAFLTYIGRREIKRAMEQLEHEEYEQRQRDGSSSSSATEPLLSNQQAIVVYDDNDTDNDLI